MQQSSSHVEKLGNWYSCFSHSICAFFPLDSHPVVYFIIWEMDGFSHCFHISWKRQQNPSSGESLGNWFPCSFYSMGIFALDSVPVAYFVIWEMHVFSHRFPISWKKQQNLWNEENLGNWFPYPFHSMSDFYYLIPIL